MNFLNDPSIVLPAHDRLTIQSSYSLSRVTFLYHVPSRYSKISSLVIKTEIKCQLRDGEMAQLYRGHTALAEVLASVPSVHVSQLRTAWNSALDSL